MRTFHRLMGTSDTVCAAPRHDDTRDSNNGTPCRKIGGQA